MDDAAVGSSTAVGKTEAPTNQNTLDKVLPKVSEIDLDFITIMDQHWSLHGVLLTANNAFYEWGIPEAQYEQCMSKETVRQALKERGIDVDRVLPRELASDGDPNKWRATGLSPIQLIVANAMLDLTDQRSDKKKLQDLGVGTGQYQRWLSDPVFAKYLANKAESLLGNSQHEASLALLDKVKAGDTAAIKLYLEYTGRFVSSADKGANGTSTDFQMIMVKIIEIITEECDGPVAFRISQRIKEATAIHAMASHITNTEIVVPDVAPMRELTPEIRALADATGAGSEY